jgi:hypothetical protein
VDDDDLYGPALKEELKIDIPVSVEEFKQTKGFPLLTEASLPPHAMIVDVNPSGDCLFRAVSVGLNGSSAGHMELRRNIVYGPVDLLSSVILAEIRYLRQTGAYEGDDQQIWTRIRPEGEAGAPQANTIEEYVADMAGPNRKWGGHWEILALSRYIKRQIIVIGQTNKRTVWPETPSPDYVGAPIFILHNGGHYIGVLTA